ncbi:restriction endonuclease subunit S, partial [Bacillus stratosphericus]
MSEWREYKISDIADVIGGGTPKTEVQEYWNGNIPWITPKDLTNYKKVTISFGARNITSEGLKSSSARLLPKGSVLITSRAPIGYVAIAENEISTNQGFKSRALKEIANNYFIYYWVKCNNEYLQSIGTGTTFLEISGNTLKNISILLPPLPEQKAIADVLSALDDKIDLLHRQNHTLEQQPETLFSQWFVEEAREDWEQKPLSTTA